MDEYDEGPGPLLLHVDDKAGRCLYANEAAQAYEGACEGGVFSSGEQPFAAGQSRLANFVQGAYQLGATQLVEKASGRRQLFDTVRIPLTDTWGTPQAVCVMMTPRVAEAEHHDEAVPREYYDVITGLANWRLLRERLTQTLTRTGSDQSGPRVLAVLNLDGFKLINSVRGRPVGDDILRITAYRLLRELHADSTLARLEAARFAALVPVFGAHGGSPVQCAMCVAQSLQRAVADDPIEIEGIPYEMSASIGVVLLQPGELLADEALREAEAASGRARQEGGGRTVFYEPQLQAQLVERLEVTQSLARALETGELHMFIQPQYARDGTVAGAELLARWRHPRRGDVPPSVFIPLAEETGLIERLTRWSFEVACQAVLDLQQAGAHHRLSVNISPKLLTSRRLIDFVRTTLRRTGVSGERLVFEVTEGFLMKDIEVVERHMQEFRALGIRFSIDDFGTGYSNLALLKRLPLSELKIDQSLVCDIPHDPDDLAITRMILGMARQLNLSVVAEGVETPEQAQFLWENMCDTLQGYLMARPIPLSQWLDAVRAGRVAAGDLNQPTSEVGAAPQSDVRQLDHWQSPSPPSPPNVPRAHKVPNFRR